MHQQPDYPIYVGPAGRIPVRASDDDDDDDVDNYDNDNVKPTNVGGLCL